MRDIKFRAWLKEENRMAEVSDISFIGEEIDVYGEDGCLGDWWAFNYIELMQYTGLKDKNSKEIYEGDIIGPDKTCRGSATYLIEWNEGHCCFTSIEGGLDNFIGDIDEEIKFNLLSNMKLSVCEVIGNIYDNPELIK